MLKKIFNKKNFPVFVLAITAIDAVFSVFHDEHSLALFCIANMLFWFTEILIRDEGDENNGSEKNDSSKT